jgi:hypothetical protein
MMLELFDSDPPLLVQGMPPYIRCPESQVSFIYVIIYGEFA